ncbi:MAG: matrixin family metalloprotease [Myxococcota bacterium]
MLVLLFGGEASAYCRMNTSGDNCALCGEDDPDAGCQYLEWDRRCIEVHIDGSGARDFDSETLRSIVGVSLDQWLNITCDDVAVDFDVRISDTPAMCNFAEFNVEEGNVNTVAFADDWERRGYDPMAYALTTVWHNTRTGRILDADIEVNQNRGTYADCPAPDGCTDGRIDLQNVMTHEFGHFFGVGHSNQPGAAMWPQSPPGEILKRFLKADDMQAICDVYPPGSLDSACDFGQVNGLSLTCPTDEGCSVTEVGRSGPQTPLSILAVVAIAGLRLRRRR